jgi:hypothetical protein
MRSSVVFGAIAVALGLLAATFFATKVFRPTSIARNEPVGLPVGPVANDGRKQSTSTSGPVHLPASSVVKDRQTHDSNNQAHAEYVRKRVAELDTLSMNNDASSRDAILSELQNSDRSIRSAALEAAIQFGDRSVLPRLQDVADGTEDPIEKAELLEAISYLNLPSLTEYLAERAAMGLTNSIPGPTNFTRANPRRQPLTNLPAR